MTAWKQLSLSFLLLVAGIAAVVAFVPGTAGLLRAVGVPEAVVGAIAPGESTKSEKAANGGGRRGADTPLVVTEAVVSGVVNDRLSAIGTGDAIRSVVVMPQATGTIREILIKSGNHVKQGQVLARLDDDEQIIARGQAEVALKSAVEKSQLYHTIKSSVSRMDVFDSEIAEQGARLALQSAELALKRRDIVAPIDGIVGIVPVVIGDNVTTTTSIVTLDDRSEVLVDYWVPERFANTVKVDQPVEATSVARPGRLFSGVVEAVDNRVDGASRTLRIRARIDNATDELRAGMSFNVGMRFAGETYPSVDPLSVQWDGEGSYVWRVADGKSSKVRVSVVQRNPDAVLVQADLKDGDRIVTEGLQRVTEGGAVRFAREVAEATEAVTQ
ncbi:efflux RND transporter periplasmic adaptor subunit [Agrobacterium rhizogenes]|uniref:efflux RND transporter periplasmic adaptor subunit n=1 Tax=Rhizobium rhizogenes TaxID=359 RepID=UPI00080FF912|nr:efflux RND transporter periplasmic adaptor subunit [Rhizobium rhizogenes]OCJ05717.1 efflux transporter periplasmic adaptor subunit [Agrobacterium sp. 13-626]NTG07892.1 efflux RND transporter periplasmic adaptor subunit [Rhizobium rhizogenes]NTG41548.1 efflux RND transporter periplasmic adaptor subunit [Rhizobium rhizogenes]NTI02580.1 efflux RND transporter periplasmic adaptor subunit [Rhizobium rhizogenes]NTI09384.1 efflux RND transporter periplasmic adaptor subunit [Rhizobium rhizogenes]